MSPEELKALRKELGATARQLGKALGVDDKTIFAWESGDLFPTKRFVDQLEALRAQGPAAFPKRPKGKGLSGPERLADPDLWVLLRKLVAHSELFDAAQKLASDYDDPAET
ncbi:MAG: helix-turn-helix domain-containing protein [Polyangiaceae bacterium]